MKSFILKHFMSWPGRFILVCVGLVVSIFAFQNCSPKVNFNPSTQPIANFDSGCGRAVDFAYSASPEENDADKQKLCSDGNSLVLPEGGDKGVTLTSDSKEWQWACQGQEGEKLKDPVTCKAPHSVPITAACEARLGKGGEFTRAGDVGRMVRAIYCLFLFRDVSKYVPAGVSDSAYQSDPTGVAFWGTLFAGGYEKFDNVLDLFEAIINDPSGNGTSSSTEKAKVETEDELVRRVNAWLSDYAGLDPTLEKGGTFDKSKPGAYARNLINSIYYAHNSVLKTKMDNAFYDSQLKSSNLYEFNNLKSFLPSIFYSFFDMNILDIDTSTFNRFGIWAAKLKLPYKGVERKFINSIMKEMLTTREFWHKPLPGAEDRTVMDLSDRELAKYLYRLVFRRNEPLPAEVDTWVKNDVLKKALSAAEGFRKNNPNPNQDPTKDPRNDYNVRAAYADPIVYFVGGSSEFCEKVPAICTRTKEGNIAPPNDADHNIISYDDDDIM